jgi:hypothetical protein
MADPQGTTERLQIEPGSVEINVTAGAYGRGRASERKRGARFN